MNLINYKYSNIEQEQALGNSKFPSGDKRRGIMTLEDIFFDSELVMEGNLLCRDGVCTDSDQEKGKEFL